MAGAAQLPRPGVEVVQQFASISPTIVQPTLVPCNIAPFFEVIEALNSDGTLNEDAKLADPYEQQKLTVPQSSFPAPRDNIDEVDVLEDSVRCFFEFGGSLIELEQDQGFLTSYLDPEVAKQPSVNGDTTTGVEPVAGYDLDGRTLIVSFDAHTAVPATVATLPTSANVTITFQAVIAGERLTIDEVIAQINSVFPGVASKYEYDPIGNAGKYVLKLTSPKFGAGASVLIRKDGSANGGTDRLGFFVDDDTIAVGSGFYSDDDSDGDLTSSRLKIYAGTSQKKVGDADSVLVGSPPNFIDSFVELGDSVIADGVLIGDISQVESDTLTMEVEQNLMSHDNPFAPRRVWVRANGLSFPVPGSSERATLKGDVETAPASPGWISGASAFSGPVGPSESLDVNVVKDGTALPTQTVSSGTGWTTLTDAVTGINSSAGSIDWEAYHANDEGNEVDPALATHVGLRTLLMGSGQALTLVSSTVTTELGFGVLPLGDIGENVRFLAGTPAREGSASAVVGAVPSTTVAITTTHLGGTPKAQESITFVGADIDAAIIDFNTNSIYLEAYRASDDTGTPSGTGTFFGIRTRGENVGTTAAFTIDTDAGAFFGTGTHTGTDVNPASDNFKWQTDFNPKEYDVSFVVDEDDGGVSMQQVLDKINEWTPGVAAASSESPPFLELTSQKYGEASKVKVLDGTANPFFGFADDAEDLGNGRPSPDFYLDINGNVVIQGQILRDSLTGAPFNPGFASIIVAYRGLRLDLSPEADSPSLLVVDDIDTLEAAADPISSDNPGALMTYLTLLNAPTVSVAAIGVSEISADAPDGTPLGYAKSFEFLQNEEVYALACASQNPVIHQNGMTHVNSMSEPEQKGERILFFNPRIPTRANPDLVGSGTDANTTATENELTLEVNIAPALIAAGLDPNLDINPLTGEIEAEVYLDLGGDDKYYLIQKVESGTILTLRTAFGSGDGNDDAFFSSTVLPSGVISDDWTVYIRGVQLLIPGTTRPDRNKIAETIQAAAQGYGFRRGFYVHPDQVGINVTGLEQLVPGYYATAAIAGMVGEQPPQQGFTNYPITGLTRPVGSNDKFTEQQLNVMAAGGTYILVQDAQGAPVISRHELSTDMTSIETRELMITKVVDFTAKFLRTGLRNFIGRSNITQPFLDNLSTVIQGQLNFLVDTSVLTGADINNIIQDADSPDTVLVDVTLDVPYPCNFIRLTLVI